MDAARANPNAPMPIDPPAGRLGSGSKTATGNPEEFGQDDKGAIQHQKEMDGVGEVTYGEGAHPQRDPNKVAGSDPEQPAENLSAHPERDPNKKPVPDTKNAETPVHCAATYASGQQQVSRF